MQIPSATFAKFCYLRYVSAVPSTCSILGQWVPNRECLCGYGEKMVLVIEFPDLKFMNDEWLSETSCLIKLPLQENILA